MLAHPRLPLHSSVLTMKVKRRHLDRKCIDGTATPLDLSLLVRFVPGGSRGICAMYKRYAGFKGSTEPRSRVLDESLHGLPKLALHWERLVHDDLVCVTIPCSSGCLLRMWSSWFLAAISDILAYSDSLQRHPWVFLIGRLASCTLDRWFAYNLYI